jgi:hypothetical protein
MDVPEMSLYELLEDVLKGAESPLTCVEIYDMPKVRALAPSINRVSDYLGGLYRKGKATRSVAPRHGNDGSRWSYSWRHKVESEERPGFKDVVHLVHNSARPSSRTLLDKPNIIVTEDADSVTIELPDFTITVKKK